MEIQLTESENLLRSLLENVAVGIVIVDPLTRVIELEERQSTWRPHSIRIWY